MDNDTHKDRLARAYLSLQGLCCGDAFGERFFLPEEVVHSLILQRGLPAPPWFFTDDTVMALSIVSTLEEFGKIDQDRLALSFAANYDSSRGYGPAMHRLLVKLRHEGTSWREESRALFGGEGSFGNGSAMRVAPLGAYFAGDLDTIAKEAEFSSVTTHCHPEAVAGAIAVAIAAGLAWRLRTSPRPPTITAFLEEIVQRTPTSQVRRGLRRAAELPAETSIEIAAAKLGNGSQVTAQDTVPFALWSAARHLNSYEEALWSTVSALGDRDTTCAIVGGIVVLYAGLESIPAEWMKCAEPIPSQILRVKDSSSPDLAQ
jgi:ADP-ribosylglycohydrolase